MLVDLVDARVRRAELDHLRADAGDEAAVGRAAGGRQLGRDAGLGADRVRQRVGQRAARRQERLARQRPVERGVEAMAFDDGGVSGVTLAGIPISVDANGDLWVNYAGPGYTFPHYSAADVIAGRIEGEALREAYGRDVVVERRRAFLQVGEVGIGELRAGTAHLLLGALDEVRADAVSEPARSRMQQHPERVALVEADLDEVVPGAERPELLAGEPARDFGMPLDDPLPLVFHRAPRGDDRGRHAVPPVFLPRPALARSADRIFSAWAAITPTSSAGRNSQAYFSTRIEYPPSRAAFVP